MKELGPFFCQSREMTERERGMKEKSRSRKTAIWADGQTKYSG
jgi:hypothetical protein